MIWGKGTQKNDYLPITKKVKVSESETFTFYAILYDVTLLFMTAFVCNCQFCTTFRTTGGQYAATIGGSHSFTESVFVFSLSLRRLECSFHRCIFLLFFSQKIWDCKSRYFFRFNKLLITFSYKMIFFIWLKPSINRT